MLGIFRFIIWLMYTYLMLVWLFPSIFGFKYSFGPFVALARAEKIKKALSYIVKATAVLSCILLGIWAFSPCSDGINSDCPPRPTERYEQSGPIKLSKKEKFNKLKEFYIERADTPAAQGDDDTKALQAGLQSLIADVEEQAKGYQSQITALASQFNLSEEALRTKVAELQAQQEQTGAAKNQYDKEVEWTKLLNDAAKQLQEANSGLVDTAQQQAAALQAVATAAGEGLQKTVNYEAPSVAASTFFSGLERPERYSQTADGV